MTIETEGDVVARQRMGRMIRLAALAACLALTACGTTYTQQRPEDYSAYYGPQQAQGSQASLFASDAAVLGDADIARVLSYNYVPPPKSRIAILPFGWTAWSGWSEQMATATETMDAQVIAQLRASPRIFDASFLPSLLVPEKRTVPYLREAAARYQADLLLVFRSSCRSFERYQLFKADRTRAFCSVEAVLLDVRTGLVPFVVNSTRTFEAVQGDTDLNFRETVMRSQLDAVGGALGEISRTVVQFVERAQ